LEDVGHAQNEIILLGSVNHSPQGPVVGRFGERPTQIESN